MSKPDEIGVKGSLLDIDETNTTEGEIDAQLAANYNSDTKELAVIKGVDTDEYGLIQEEDGTWTIKEYDCLKVKPEPTTIISKAIEQVEQMGDYKVMFALVDLDKSKPKKECLYTFTDIESKKLREVIYKEMEMERECDE